MVRGVLVSYPLDSGACRLLMAKLSDLSSFGELEEGAFVEVVKEIFLLLGRERRGTESIIEKHISPLGPVKGHQAYASVTSILLEAAKADDTCTQLQTRLEDAGLGSEQIKVVVSGYEHKKGQLRQVLGRTGFGSRRLVDADWRLDYHVKSSVTGNDNEPIYYLTLKAQNDDGTVEDIKIACSLAELQDFHAKVKDATKQLERIFASGQLDN